MKKLTFCSAVFFVIVHTSLFAGSIDYLTNQSAKLCATFHRTASTDPSADIAGYNPAGTAFLEKGLYLDLSSQTLFKFYSESGADSSGEPGSFEQDTPTPALPNLYAVYSFGNIGPCRHAVYLQAGIVAGGGTLEWKDGTIGTYAKFNESFSTLADGVTAHSFTVSSVYYGIGAGVAYSFLKDLFSVSAGVRLVMPDRWVEMKATSGQILSAFGTINLSTKFTYSAMGFTPVIGVDVRPLKGLTLGLRYECETELQFEYKQDYLTITPALAESTVKDGLASGGLYDGNRFNINLPQILSMGAEYDMSDYVKGLAVMWSANIYFLPYADLGPYYDSSDGSRAGNINEFFNTGWESGLGASYRVLPGLTAKAGFMYTESGAKKNYFSSHYTILNCSANPPLDSFTLGTGATYFFSSIGLDATLGFTWTHYIPVKTSVDYEGTVYSVEYKKDIYNIACGLGYKL